MELKYLAEDADLNDLKVQEMYLKGVATNSEHCKADIAD